MEPVVEGLAAHVLDTALDPHPHSVARRAGVVVTRAVERRTTLLVTRLRHQVTIARGSHTDELLAEQCSLIALTGAPASEGHG